MFYMHGRMAEGTLPNLMTHTHPQDCHTPVAAEFFPFETETGTLPLCERDYFRRLGLVCAHCDEALRGAYIIASDKKYHTDHFMCSACSTTFGTDDSYYEHNGQVFCHFHYSTQFAVMCAGCQMAILKQYVEIDRKDAIDHWHLECYMIHKYWNVKVAQHLPDKINHPDYMPQNPAQLLEMQHEMEDKVFRIWQVLSAFEESSAVCISEMMLHVSNAAYLESICLSERFLVHVEALFAGVDELCKLYIAYQQEEFKYTREAKMLCKKIINFFSLLSRTQEMKKLGITQELLSLVTGLAHYLKSLLRVALTAALQLLVSKGSLYCNQELLVNKPVAVSRLLAKLMEVAGKERHSRDSQMLIKGRQATDVCHHCRTTIEDQCWRYGQCRWHLNCFQCRQCKRPLSNDPEQAVFSSASSSLSCVQCTGLKTSDTTFEHITKLSQYAFLLRVALSRLCSLLQITDNQLSTVDISIKSRLAHHGKDASGKELVPSTLDKMPGMSSVLEDKTNCYPTDIPDVKVVHSTKLERKMSRSFKTAKRSTIFGNVNMNTPVVYEEPQRNSRPAPARLDSLKRRMDQHKDLPPLPHTDMSLTGQQQPFQPVILEDNPPVSMIPSPQPHILEDRPCTTNTLSENQRPMINRTIATSPSGRPRIYFSELSALQYMIVRHVAVVQIEPYVRNFFSLSELLNLIEFKKSSIWGKFFTSFRTGGTRRGYKGKEEGTFGVSLDFLTEKTGVESNLGAGPSPIKIPAFIDDAITAMRQMDMSVEGVFRKNGNIKRLKDLSEQLDKNPHDVDLSSDNAIQIAALLKKFLREMPDPLLTYKLFSLFICADKIENSAARKRVLHLACCMLPRCNRDTMEVLFLFLRWVASFSHISSCSGSRMDIPNLARVMAPNILTSSSKDPTKDESFTAIHVIEMLLESYEEFCLVSLKPAVCDLYLMMRSMWQIPEDMEEFLEDPTLTEATGELSSKEFLKKMELVIKKRHPNDQTRIPETSTSPMYAQHHHTPYPYTPIAK
ncbi:hypothetical protein EC973_006985 [Apophysomyces ossiformis]|uniref:Uncharacterized protein n=1 Tax=Apophysomyces ossiformis TaxID=679940 RepID=A0A8H7BVM8_9FUNG|nr:hypothetical protein EC973_006985 [Apophysomyces ossiformis]